jgi:hypothetical protein
MVIIIIISINLLFIFWIFSWPSWKILLFGWFCYSCVVRLLKRRRMKNKEKKGNFFKLNLTFIHARSTVTKMNYLYLKKLLWYSSLWSFRFHFIFISWNFSCERRESSSIFSPQKCNYNEFIIRFHKTGALEENLLWLLFIV